MLRIYVYIYIISHKCTYASVLTTKDKPPILNKGISPYSMIVNMNILTYVCMDMQG